MTVVDIHLEKVIAAPPAEVFDWLAGAAGLTTAPMALRAGWVPGFPGPAGGARRWLIGVGLWIREEEITFYDPPHSYSYLVLRAVPAMEHRGGSMTFTPVDDGNATHVSWRSSYTHPARWGGRVTQAISAPLLRKSFRAILDGCARDLER